jgi:hypothetical protein
MATGVVWAEIAAGILMAYPYWQFKLQFLTNIIAA